MMSEIPKAYEPQAVEEKWYDFWLKQNCFTADAKSSKPAYSIVIPPPNVTGMLHMGHVLNNTIQDILSRKARMDGKEVLWLPGTDHAGIATQVQVEKALKKEERKTKYDLGREEFLKRVWAWKEKHGGIIINQLKKLGCSCDWTRERFTMDPEYSRCVQKVFVELYKKGLIYRRKRMVNWDPNAQTALSDEEVIMKERREWLYTFSVPVIETDGSPVWDDKDEWVFLKIATTRPETIPGDVAIAVNPKDPRYQAFVGKFAIRPLPIKLPLAQKLIPIIADKNVDFEFGTGVLKVTPCHDKADFEIAERHHLPSTREVIDAKGIMTELAGELAGLDRFEARTRAMKMLLDIVKLEGGHFGAATYAHRVPVAKISPTEEPYTHNVGFSERTDIQIEPRLSEQWFLKYPAVEQSKACVAGGLMKLHPDRWEKVYDHWLMNIQDWCISRQLWWGHRIPSWHGYWEMNALEMQETLDGIVQSALSDGATPEDIKASVIGIDGLVCPITNLETIREFVSRFGGVRTNHHVSVCTLSQNLGKQCALMGLDQDPDVLDTWFSSWLWPFATMGWPTQTETLKKFYPTTDLVTGPDIIFFWVARMIMAGYEFMHEMPFRNVYFTGIIRDKQGRKMSKTLGNSPDPLDLIGRYGADALRFGTMRSAPLGQDVLFDEKDVELGRNFCNKLWNACRFRQMQGGEVQGEIEPSLLTSDDKWILLKVDAAIREISEALNTYNFSTAVQTLYRFFWSEYCDWYVEASKAVLHGDDSARKANTLAVIDFVLSHTLRLFHPFLPFITEELWHGMGFAEDMPPNQGGKTIMFAPWPKPLDEDFTHHYGLEGSILDAVNAKYNLVTEGRNLRRAGNISASKKVKFIFKPVNSTSPHDIEVMKLLLNAEAVEVNAAYQPAKGTPTMRTELGELCLPLEGLVDVTAEKVRLNKEREKIEGDIAKTEQKLANPNFVQKVPPQVLAEHQQRQVDLKAKLEHVLAALKALEGL